MTDLIEFLRARLDEDEQRWCDMRDGGEQGYWDFMLAEVDAKRRLVDWHTNQHDLLGSVHPTTGCRCYGGWPCPTLRLLALPYADHPDYREEWRP